MYIPWLEMGRFPMSGLAGFDFQRLNLRFLGSLQQPVNLAADYGVSITPTPAGDAWRCIGVYHLPPEENRGRHNCFIEVLDEHGLRTRTPLIKWTWWIDATVQTLRLDKPDNEPAADIPLEVKSTVTLRVDGGGLPSDSVGNVHTRHNDEGAEKWNSYGHHSFYVVFQRQGTGAVVPPVITTPIEPPTMLTLELLAERIAAVEHRLNTLEGDGR